MPAMCCAPTARAALSTDGLLAYCRPGFEPELAAELSERAAVAGFAGYAKTQRNSGYVEFLMSPCDSYPADGESLSKSLPYAQLVFARQKMRLFAELDGLDPKDR